MIISHPHVIQSPVANKYSKVKFDGVNGRLKAELRQKVLLRVYVHEIHIDMLNKYANGFFHEI